MYVKVDINADDIANQFHLSEQEVSSVIDLSIKNLAGKFAELWEHEAELSLHSTRERYIQNLHVIDEGRMTGTVLLDYSKDPLIKMLEEGASAFDQKQYFKKSDKVKYNKAGGWYLTIPFKLGTPNAVGDSLGGITNLPPQVYAVVKQQPINPATNRSAGLKGLDIPEPFNVPQTRASIPGQKSDIFEAYKHKSSIFEGAFKQKDTVTGQNTYGSFRRVGQESEDNAFIFPGLERLDLADKALTKLDAVMDIELQRSINQALASFGFE